MPKVKCEDCVFAFKTFSEIMPDALCTNEKINLCNLAHTWNKNLRYSKKLRYCKGFKPFQSLTVKLV